MTAEQVFRIFADIMPWLAAVAIGQMNKNAFSQLEDVAGCNGDVQVSIHEDGYLVLQGPYSERLEVHNWNFAPLSPSADH